MLKERLANVDCSLDIQDDFQASCMIYTRKSGKPTLYNLIKMNEFST